MLAHIDTLIPQLKRQHGELIVFQINLRRGPATFVFRPLSALEFEGYLSIAEVDDVAEDIISNSLVYPAGTEGTALIGEALPGIYESIALQIVAASGFSNPKEAKRMLNEGKMRARTFPAVVEMFICKAFPTYIPETVRKMTVSEQFKLVAMAEEMLGIEFPMKAFFGKPEVTSSAVPDASTLQYVSDAQIERESRGAVSKIGLERVRAKQAALSDPEIAAERRQQMRDRIAQRRLTEG
jgi:hypothetical protein